VVVVLSSAGAFYALPSLRLRRAFSSCIGAIVDSRFLLVVVLPSARAFTPCLLFVYRGNRRLPLSSGCCPPKCTSVYAVPSLRVSGNRRLPLSSGRCPPKCTSVYVVPSLRVSGQSSTPAPFWSLSSQVGERSTPCLVLFLGNCRTPLFYAAPPAFLDSHFVMLLMLQT